jgi:malate permease and related proteins
MLADKLIPIIVIFFAGYFLKLRGVFSRADGALFLRGVVYICLPVIGFSTFSHLDLGIERIYPIITSFFVIIGNFLFTLLYFKKLRVKPESYTVYLLSVLILNTSLMLPFAQAKWGDEGAATVLLFDVCNVVMIFTFSYWVAMRYGNARRGRVPFGRILRLPPLWGILLGIAFNIGKIPVPGFVAELSVIAKGGLIVLMMTSLGIFFELKIKHFGLVAGAVLQRSIGGIMIGVLLTWILGMQGTGREIIIFTAAAPVGFNTLVLSELEDLDNVLAAEIVTTATLLAVIILPIVLVLM